VALEMPRLTKLHLGSSGFSQLTSAAGGRVYTGMRALVCAPWFGRLQSLVMRCQELPTFDDLAGCDAPCLERFVISCQGPISDAAATALGKLALPSLRTLGLHGEASPPVVLTARGIAALLAAEGLTRSLQELRLSQTSASSADGDAVVAAIACAPLAALHSLSICECRHTDASIASLARASWAPQLTWLDFNIVDGGFHLKGAAWRTLAARLVSVRQLDLHFEPDVSAGVAAHLMSASWLGGLQRLSLSGISRGAFEVLEASPVFASLQASQDVNLYSVEAG
jgi:hypothetical protein